jgi:hypothetical protein
MREAAVFQTEAEFRAWFERNLTRFGFRRIILAQEPCPDYVLEKLDGTIVRAEAELFAVNFRYHRHDPAKVDLIIACYAKEPELDGVPVIAANELWAEGEEVLEPLSPEGELSNIEAIILSIAFATGGVDISALAMNSTDKRLAGDHNVFFRIPPEAMGRCHGEGWRTTCLPLSPKTPGSSSRSITTSLLEAASPRKLAKPYSHSGGGVSRRIDRSQLQLLFYDGVFVKHPGWVPTEVEATDDARRLHRSAIRSRMFP